MFRLICSCLVMALAAPVLASDHTAALPGRIEVLNQSDVPNAAAAMVTAIHFPPGGLLFNLGKTDFDLAVETLKSGTRSFLAGSSAEKQRLRDRNSDDLGRTAKSRRATSFGQAGARAVRSVSRATLTG